MQNAANEVQVWAGASPQVGGSQPPLVETPGAVQPRLAADGDNRRYDSVASSADSFDDTFEDAEDEVIKLIKFTLVVGTYNLSIFITGY